MAVAFSRALQMLFRWLPAVLAGEEWAAVSSLFWVGSLSFLSGGFKIFYLNSVSGSPRCGLFFQSILLETPCCDPLD